MNLIWELKEIKKISRLKQETVMCNKYAKSYLALPRVDGPIPAMGTKYG